MRHLNYNHLLYFWTVSREGSITSASESLHLTPQTVSAQIKLLEKSIGQPLFKRAGRGLVLTDTGRIVQEYADEIFSAGIELAQHITGDDAYRSQSLRVGIVNSIPKLIAYRILEPALDGSPSVRITCQEASLDQLLGDLAIHRLDLVVSDHAVPVGLNIRAFNHRLGTSAIGFFASRSIAKKYAGNFPASLHEAPVLLPVLTNPLRRSLNDWFQLMEVQPNVIAEFDDSALLKAFGEAGTGLFPAPVAIRAEIEKMYHARCIGQIDSVQESYFAISPERKLKHPAVLRITEVARSALLEH
ncbi:MAG: transcriptional activator NhaR [Gammaproteobacteria bacterium]|jgi:LysR family transcriptional activator of nhaA